MADNALGLLSPQHVIDANVRKFVAETSGAPCVPALDYQADRLQHQGSHSTALLLSDRQFGTPDEVTGRTPAVRWYATVRFEVVSGTPRITRVINEADATEATPWIENPVYFYEAGCGLMWVWDPTEAIDDLRSGSNVRVWTVRPEAREDVLRQGADCRITSVFGADFPEASRIASFSELTDITSDPNEDPPRPSTSGHTRYYSITWHQLDYSLQFRGRAPVDLTRSTTDLTFEPEAGYTTAVFFKACAEAGATVGPPVVRPGSSQNFGLQYSHCSDVQLVPEYLPEPSWRAVLTLTMNVWRGVSLDDDRAERPGGVVFLLESNNAQVHGIASDLAPNA